MASRQTFSKSRIPDDSAEPDRLAAIYRSAAAVIVRKGFHATSMNDIAAAVDLTKAGLYHYVSGKQDLLFEIMQFAMDLVDHEVLEPARQIDDPEKRLRFILATHASLSDYTKETTILAEEVSALTEESRRVIVRRKRQYFDFVRATLVELADEGKLADVDVTVATFNLFATLLGISRWYKVGGRLSAEEVAAETTQLLLGGLLK